MMMMILIRVGPPNLQLSHKQVELVLAAIDQDGDGMISITEFCDLVYVPTSLHTTLSRVSLPRPFSMRAILGACMWRA